MPSCLCPTFSLTTSFVLSLEKSIGVRVLNINFVSMSFEVEIKGSGSLFTIFAFFTFSIFESEESRLIKNKSQLVQSDWA